MEQKRGSAVAARGNAAYYRSLLTEQEASGKSLRAFARERGLSAWTLYGWRGRLGRSRRRGRVAKETERSGGLVAVDVVGGAQVPGDFEVVLSDGLLVRVPRDIAIVRLAELVRELRRC